MDRKKGQKPKTSFILNGYSAKTIKTTNGPKRNDVTLDKCCDNSLSLVLEIILKSYAHTNYSPKRFLL